MFFTIEEAKKTNLDFQKRTVKVLQIYFAYNYWWSKITIIMEYQKIINLLENTPNQPSKFRAKYWVETHVVIITPIVKLSLRLQC